MLPSRRRRDTCNAATRGVSCSATETTTWEYASSAATSGSGERMRVSVITRPYYKITYLLIPESLQSPCRARLRRVDRLREQDPVIESHPKGHGPFVTAAGAERGLVGARPLLSGCRHGQADSVGVTPSFVKTLR